MTERCKECGWPQPEYNRDPAFDCVHTGDVNCDGRAVVRLKAQAQRDQATITAARKCIEAADRELRPLAFSAAVAINIGGGINRYDRARAEFAKVEALTDVLLERKEAGRSSQGPKP